MDPFPLSKVTSLNIAQILKKCNDTSFVRSIRTCRRFYDVANKMEKETRVFCHARLSVFIYFDEKMGQAMFDLPHPKKKNRRNKEDFVTGFPDPVSRIDLTVSDDKQPSGRKMTPQELGQILRFFRFDQVYFDTHGGLDTRDEFPLMLERVLETFPYIRARSLAMQTVGQDPKYPMPKNLSQKTYQLAYKHLKLKELRFYNYGHYFGLIEELEIDWHSLESLRVSCSNENFSNIHKEFITNWKSGEMNLKRLRIASTDYPKGFDMKILEMTPNFFVKMRTHSRGNNGKFYYYHFPSKNRWAITYTYCWNSVYCFNDISDCDGCDCQTEFCFKKFIEAIARVMIKWDNVVDFGPIVDEWNGLEVKTLETLGGIMKPFMKRIVQNEYCCC